MRPRGEIREVLASAARTMHQQRGLPVTWRDMAEHAQVGYEAARHTVRNMARAGELRAVSAIRAPGVCRPMAGYVPVAPGLRLEGAAPALDALMRMWSRGPE